MKFAIQLIGGLGLLLTIVPATLVFVGSMELSTHKWLMLLGVVLWFGSRWGKGWVSQQGEEA